MIAFVSPVQGQSLPSGWTAADIGGPAVRGSATFSGDTFTVSGAGADIWGRVDQFMFVHRQLTGDGTIVARVDGVQNTHHWAKAGVMIRESLAAGSRNAYAFVSAARGVAFQRRTSTNGSTVSTIVSGAAPEWVRIERAGSSITASRSADGVTWSRIGTQSMTLPATIYVGLAVTSHNVAIASRAALSSVSLTTPAADSASQWSSSDIGSGILPGSTTVDGGVFTVKGAGRDIWGTSDQFRFVYRQVTGDTDVIARVTSVLAVDVWTKAGVMIRSSLAANSAHASLFVSGAKGVAFQRRPTTGAVSVHTAGGGRTAPWWVKLSRRGATITAFQSPDGRTWSAVSAQALALPATFYVGLAVTSHDAARVAAATFENVSVESLSSVAGQDPVVSLTAPIAGATYTAPATISIAARAVDSDGSIARVDFYAGTTRIATDTTAPYAATWTGVAAGTYSLTAVAYDATGGMTVSGGTSITVQDPQLPKVAVFVPSSDDATAVDRYIVEFFPSTADPDVSNPVATVDIGKPPVVDGESRADVSHAVAALPPGSYIATVTAVGSGGSARSAPSPAFIR